MKDPAFLLYSSDFLTGCTSLTMEERGQYITMLCIQHQTGYLTEKTISLSVGNVSDDVLAKFKKNENGFFLNQRLELEIKKRSKFIDSKRLNGKKGGRPKNKNKPSAKPNAKAKKNLIENEIENENINENGIINKNEIKNQNFDFDFLNQCPDFLPLLLSWIKYKNHTLHQNLTQQQIESFFTQLLDLSDKNPATAQKIITQSISAGHRVIYELINSNKSPPGQQKSQKSNLQIIQDVDKIVQQKINEMPMF